MLRRQGESQNRNRKVLRTATPKTCNRKTDRQPETDSRSMAYDLFTDD